MKRRTWRLVVLSLQSYRKCFSSGNDHSARGNIRWHDLRHTCATLLLSRGTHPKMVQHLLGHASIQLTLDRYSHWMPSMGRATVEGMDEALG